MHSCLGLLIIVCSLLTVPQIQADRYELDRPNIEKRMANPNLEKRSQKCTRHGNPPCKKNYFLMYGCCEACQTCQPGQGKTVRGRATPEPDPEDIGNGVQCQPDCHKCPPEFYQKGDGYKCQPCFTACGLGRHVIPYSCNGISNTRCSLCKIGLKRDNSHGEDLEHADCAKCQPGDPHPDCAQPTNSIMITFIPKMLEMTTDAQISKGNHRGTTKRPYSLFWLVLLVLIPITFWQRENIKKSWDKIWNRKRSDEEDTIASQNPGNEEQRPILGTSQTSMNNIIIPPASDIDIQPGERSPSLNSYLDTMPDTLSTWNSTYEKNVESSRRHPPSSSTDITFEINEISLHGPESGQTVEYISAIESKDQKKTRAKPSSKSPRGTVLDRSSVTSIFRRSVSEETCQACQEDGKHVSDHYPIPCTEKAI